MAVLFIVNLGMARFRVPLFIFVMMICKISSSQNGELRKFDCSYAKEIIVPFDHDGKPLLNQKVFYSFRDQFTYWYKVVVKEDHILNFKVKALNDSDAYSVYVYTYNQPDFCDKVYYQKIFPVKATFFIGKGASDINSNEKSFPAKKGNAYYIGVLNTSINNCGHNFTLIYQKDTLRVDAIHLPCKRDVSSMSVNTPAKKDSVVKVELPLKKIVTIPVTVTTDTALMENKGPAFFKLNINTLNAKNKLPVDATVIVSEKTSSYPVDVFNLARGEFRVSLDAAKTYVIKTIALGYTQAEIIVNTAELVAQKKERQEILLDPIKQGQSFVLKSIYFVPNTFALRKESQAQLENLLEFLKMNKNTVIEIQGHTNGDNHIVKNKAYASLSEEWNFSGSSKKLSQKRSEAIKTYLMINGISETRLVAKGYGGQKYLIKDPESNDEAQKNIRVEVSVLKN